MKSLFSILIISALSFHAFAQESAEKIMEGRAKEMMRVIGLNDKEQWKKFIKENCTQAFIDRNMKAKVTTADGRDETTEETSSASSNLDAKAEMFARLHHDFGDGKITSLKTNADKGEMMVNAAELVGTFRLKYESKKPYLIDGLGIEAGN